MKIMTMLSAVSLYLLWMNGVIAEVNPVTPTLSSAEQLRRLNDDSLLHLLEGDSSQKELPVNSKLDSSQKELPVNSKLDSSQKKLLVNSKLDSSQKKLPVNSKLDSSQKKLPVNSKLDSSQKELPVNSKLDSSQKEFFANLKPDPFFYFQAGSLHKNIKALSEKFHYSLLWHVVDDETGQLADFDYVGDETVSAKTVPEILDKAMKPYNVQVKVWTGNHVICVTSDGSCE